MAKYRLITDSGCDITEEEERLYEIDILPFDVILGEKRMRERIDIKGSEFLRMLDAMEEIPKTSQVTTARFEEKFEECASSGVEDVIVVLINGVGSGTFANAVQAAETLKSDGRAGNMRFHIIDSHTYSIGYGYPLIEAAKKLRSGQSVEAAVSYLEDWFSCCELYLVAFSLRHMRKSGRIKAASAVVGELMNIKPVISMIDSDTAIVLKCRGEKRAIGEAVNFIVKRAIPKTPILIARSLITDLEDDLIGRIQKKTGEKPAYTGQVGCAVGSNAGTKFIGVFIKGQKRR
ncbi:MAG: DegV family protein [Ruminiclostridium sp.]